jgi:tetratricopeptide (TPR) repeat protein
MATPDPSIPSASELPPPPPDTPSIPLPSDRTESSPAPHASRQRLIDFLLIGIAVGFAFLAASFAARNSDFWMHLASGRLLAEGRYHFGVDPFSYTTEGVYWANHAWLFDLLLYAGFTQLGGTLLVVLKALLIALLAAVLMSVRRPESRLAVPALMTLLTVLAMSPRLLLHSTCLSYVFLGLTLWLLWRARHRMAVPRSDLARHAPLLLLFVLWVNVDDWFLLGPLLAALFWLGDVLLPAPSAGETPRRTPAWVWLAGLAVCLVNPHHYHAFTLPVELAPLPPQLHSDARFEALYASPWRMSLLYQPLAGVNLAMSAYLALLVVGVASFVVNARSLVGWRLLVWLSFAGLSAWVARAIPFFAVVAGPIATLNWQDYLSQQGTNSLPEGIGRRVGRLFVLAVGLALIFLAWPGWLQGWPDTGRHVDWTVQLDASLQRMAERLQYWHQQGKLRDGHGFLAHPSLVHYCAWFCPEEKGFLDHRLPLFAAVAGEFEELHQAFNPGSGSRRDQSGKDWRAVLRKHDITHAVLYDSNLARLQPALRRLAIEEDERVLLESDSLALLIGWREGERMRPDGVPAFDADRLSFRPSMGPEDEQRIPPVPGRGPLRGPRSADFWTHFASPVAPSPWETGSAGVLLRYFEARAPGQQQERVMRCVTWPVTLLGSPALSSGSLESALRLVAAVEQMPFAPGDLGQQPPALPLLAVRLARRALAENPDDASAYLFLAQAYSALRDLTPERTVLGIMPPLAQLRHIQIAVALENVVRCQPDHAGAHEALARLYERRPFFDAALAHRREALRLVRRAGPRAGEKPEDFTRRTQEMEDSVRVLELNVGERKNEFALRAQQLGSEPYRKAQLALNMGLARLALDDVLLQSPMVLLGGDGVRLQMELLLQMGRIDSVRDQLRDADWQANKQNLGYVELPVRTPTGHAPPFRVPAYDWLLLCESAAFGDYDQADAAVRTLLTGLGEQQTGRELTILRPSAAQVLAMELGVSASRPSWIPRELLRDHQTFLATKMNALAYAIIEQADVQVIAGMLSLERGQPREAAQSFRKALTLSDLAGGASRPSMGRPLAEAYLQILTPVR